MHKNKRQQHAYLPERTLQPEAASCWETWSDSYQDDARNETGAKLGACTDCINETRHNCPTTKLHSSSQWNYCQPQCEHPAYTQAESSKSWRTKRKALQKHSLGQVLIRKYIRPFVFQWPRWDSINFSRQYRKIGNWKKKEIQFFSVKDMHCRPVLTFCSHL